MYEKIGWFFPEENNPADRYVDEFADSKFNIDRWVSFAREIIQNSLDVVDTSLNPSQPVLVKMEYSNISKDEIPGCVELEKCIQLAMDGAIEKKSNKQTINRYKKGLEILSKNSVPCFKVSDYRTIGVRSGRDNEWGALVFDEGKSLKSRPGSAGSHGVGKKAPFIISSVNTVFYSTYNKANEFLFQGKTSLINWVDENGITRNGKGWYGLVDPNNEDRKKRVVHLSEEFRNNANPFFSRSNEYGTDVIIIGVNLDDFERIKTKVINSILENFFVAINNSKLELNVFGEKINSENLDKYVKDYYLTKRKNFFTVEGMEKSVFGNLMNYYNAFLEDPIVFDVVNDGKRYGRCSVYFSLENDKNRKYYCIFRNHGMKIRDINLSSAEQPFSAVVYIDDVMEDDLEEDDRLNARLSSVENAAHDDFIIDNEDFECDPITKSLVESIYKKVEDIILEKTRIEALDETPLEGLDEMLAIQGMLQTKITSKKPSIKKRKNKIRKKSLGKKAEDYEEGVSYAGGGDRKKKHKGAGEHKPAKEGDNFKATLFKKFYSEPLFIRSGDDYILVLKPSEDALSDVRIMPISVEGTLNRIPNLLLSAKIGDTVLDVEDNVIKNVPLTGGKPVSISLIILNNYNYSLECDVFVGGEQDD